MMRLWVSTETPDAGDTITICITLEFLSYGQTTVTITNPVTQQAEDHVVDLDANGRGCFTWVVPQWATAVITHPASDDLALVIG